MPDPFDDPSDPSDREVRDFARAAERASRDARVATEQIQRLSTALANGLGPAVSRLIFDGARASDVFRSLAASLARSTLSSSLKPVQAGLAGAVTKGLGGLVSGAAGALGFAKGAAFAAGAPLPSPPAALRAGARPFAKGGLVDSPTVFPMRSGLGVMGEAGPEAVLPLARGPDGRLGVSASGGAGGAVNVVIHARDAESFRRSRSQIAAQMARALERGRRTL